MANMTQEEKQLLLADLCARLPYGVLCDYVYNIGHPQKLLSISPGEKYQIHLDSDEYVFGSGKSYGRSEITVEDVKPYLRPMSSMTEEELAEYEAANDLDTKDSSETLRENLKAKSRVRISTWYHGSDWLDANFFDYRGLIPMGLALEAPKDMYKIE